MTGNCNLAAKLRRQADAAMHHRKVLLVAAVALAESSTVAAAVRRLDTRDGPATVKAAAIELLGRLADEARAVNRGPDWRYGSQVTTS